MPRVANSSIRRYRHRKLISRATGFRLKSKNVFKRASERLLKAGQHAYIGRKMKKRLFRRTWISQINAALQPFELKYNLFINGLTKANVGIDRKVMADIAQQDSAAFSKIVELAKK